MIRPAFMPTFVTVFAMMGAGNALAAPAKDCEGLRGLSIPASQIALPTQGAIIETAQLVSEDKTASRSCRVNGAILAQNASSPPIKFQVNLPLDWNGKALHFGGGGFNGVLVTGLGAGPGGGAADPTPLKLGYVTFGSDGGHQAKNGFDATFGLDAEALGNYAGAAVKKTHDAAVALMSAFYGRAPRRVYFAGGSKGGHEALVAAQRYGADYDGVISFFPAKDSTATIFAWAQMDRAAYGPGGAALSAAKQRFVMTSVLAACDSLDGLKDGVIANTAACQAAISPAALRCPAGAPAGNSCLTEAEARTLEVGLQRTEMPFVLANGVSSFAPFPVMTGADLANIWMSEAGRGTTAYSLFVDAVAQYFWSSGQQKSFPTFDPQHYAASVLAYSRMADATSVDLEVFRAHGGKMIVVQGTTDMLVPPGATTDYFLRLAARYGAATGDFARYFMQPGYGHGAGAFTLQWDALSALDTWVEKGKAPLRPVAVDAAGPAKGRQLPLCEYPRFPRFVKGDPAKAASFECALQ